MDIDTKRKRLLICSKILDDIEEYKNYIYDNDQINELFATFIKSKILEIPEIVPLNVFNLLYGSLTKSKTVNTKQSLHVDYVFLLISDIYGNIFFEYNDSSHVYHIVKDNNVYTNNSKYIKNLLNTASETNNIHILFKSFVAYPTYVEYLRFIWDKISLNDINDKDIDIIDNTLYLLSSVITNR